MSEEIYISVGQNKEKKLGNQPYQSFVVMNLKPK